MNIGGKLLARHGARRPTSPDGTSVRPDWIPSRKRVVGGAALLCGGLAGIATLVVVGWDSWTAARVAVRCCLGFTTVHVSWRVVAYLITPGFDRTLDGIHSNFADFRYAPVRCALNLLAVAAPIAALVVASHWSRVRFGQPWPDRRGGLGRLISELIELAGTAGSAP